MPARQESLLLLTLAPLFHFLAGIDAVVVQHLLQHGEQTPPVTFAVHFSLDPEERQRLDRKSVV